ncbi:MAG: hypothetical protein HC884_18145, partial [Chloroflexaceae bacterium]|nr:hypothetical protein [Chloroflexaceae bacterium]
PLLQHSIVTTSLCSITEAGEHLPIYPHRLYFLNPFYVNEHTPAGVADWLRLAAESITNPQHPTLNLERPILERATQLIMEDGITPQERAQMFEETGYENHLQLRYAEGRKAGLETGQRQKAQEIARAMLAQGMELPLIAQVTGLPPDEVADLARGGG